MIKRKILLLMLLTAAILSCKFINQREDIIFSVGIGNEPTSLDPHFCNDQYGQLIINELFIGLLRGDPKTGGYRPGLAKSWNIDPNNLRYTFNLRNDVYWSDGVKLTAKTVKDSYIRALKKGKEIPEIDLMTSTIKNAEEFSKSQVLDNELGIKVINDHTLEITIVNPKPYFLDMLTYPIFYPLPMHIVEKYENGWIKPVNIVTSGPFTLKSRILNDEIIIKKNNTYYDSKTVKIDEIIFITLNDESRIYDMYEHNEIDAIFGNIPIRFINELVLREDFYLSDINQVGFYAINTTITPLNKIKFREALALAIDRETLIYSVLDNGYKATRRIVPNYYTTNYKHYYKNLKLYDPKQAKKLLSEAGYPNGKGLSKFKLRHSTNELETKLAFFAQEQWKKVLNIDIELVPAERNEHILQNLKGNYDISIGLRIGEFLDPITFLNIFKTNTIYISSYGYSNPEFDALLEQAEVETDIIKRTEILTKAENIIIEKDFPVVTLYTATGSYLFRNDKWTGWKPNISERFALSEIKPLENSN